MIVAPLESGIQAKVIFTQLRTRVEGCHQILALSRATGTEVLCSTPGPTWEPRKNPESCGSSSQPGLWGRGHRFKVLHGPGLSPGVHVGHPCGCYGGSSMLLHPSLIFDPIPKYREPRVHAWLVPLSAAFTPAHHTSLEHPSFFLHAGQGATRVTLCENRFSA